MRKLSDIPIDELRTLVGSKVQSLNTKVFGRITQISDEPDREDYNVHIYWDNLSRSDGVWHFWCDKIILVEENK